MRTKMNTWAPSIRSESSRRPIGITPTEEQIERLVDVLTPHIEREAQTLHTSYVWPEKPIKRPPPLPGFSSDGLSKAESVMRLKRALADKWRSDPPNRQELARWFVEDWGGVRANSGPTIQRYINCDEEDLASGPLKGIASWSKVLTIRNPDRFAIFDARVSASLNALQWVEGGTPLLFPHLPTQNRRLALDLFQRQLRAQGARRPYHRISSLQVYPTYMRILHSVSQRLGHQSPDVAEMVLFANVGALVRKAVPDRAC